MEVQVNIDPKQIEQMVATAVLQSALGETIEKEINSAVKSLSHYDGPIQKAIRVQVQQIVSNVVRDEYADKIRASVRERLTDEVVSDITGKAFQAFLDKM